MVTSLNGHTIVELILVERGILLAIVWLFLLSHNIFKLLLSRLNSVLPVWSMIFKLNGHAIINLLKIDSLVVSFLLLSLSFLSRLEFLLGKSISGSVNLTSLLFAFFLSMESFFELSSLLFNLLVPESRVVLILNILTELEGDIIWGDSIVDIVEVNSSDLSLFSLVLSKLLSLLSLLSLLLSFLLNGLSLLLLSGFLSSEFILLFLLHHVLKLISLLLNHGVPFLGVMVVITSLLSVIIDIFGIISVWDVSVVELNVHSILSGLLIHDFLNLSRLLLGKLSLDIILELRFVHEWLSLLVWKKLITSLEEVSFG